MAGSYNHCTDDEGRLYANEDLVRMLENGGDVYEAVVEMFGMIWFLAAGRADRVETARENYTVGLAISPGTEGHLTEED